MPSTSCSTRYQVASNFFSVAGEWWCKVNKTQWISAKKDRFKARLIVCTLMQLISEGEI